MSLFKRLSATLVSRIDQVVGEIENHDAVIQATLDGLCKKVAVAKQRLAQARREEDRVRQQILEQNEQVERWRLRAVESAHDDEAKALECVRRSRLGLQKIERLEQSLSQSLLTTEKLARDIDASEQRLGEIKQKLILMRARNSAGSARNATHDTDIDTVRLLDETFDRWEISLTQSELVCNTPDAVGSIDSIEREFLNRETQEALRNELAALLTEEGKQ